MPVGADAVIAVDTSVALPLLLEGHVEHDAVQRWSVDRRLALSGHALAETYSVLTRLPGDMRLMPADAARLLAARFDPPLAIDPSTASRLHSVLAELQISGGATYDGMIALAARAHNCVLATRDARARATYDAVGVTVEIVP
jgi:predicted nucleic acid-binding protein